MRERERECCECFNGMCTFFEHIVLELRCCKTGNIDSNVNFVQFELYAYTWINHPASSGKYVTNEINHWWRISRRFTIFITIFYMRLEAIGLIVCYRIQMLPYLISVERITTIWQFLCWFSYCWCTNKFVARFNWYYLALNRCHNVDFNFENYLAYSTRHVIAFNQI